MTKQLPLPLDSIHRAAAISKRASKQRRSAKRTRLPIIGQSLPIADSNFNPVAGVPKTRKDCPSGYCPHVRCRWHLALETSEHRAGRPGLASIPRDERGLTISTPGHAGDARPGTTLRPTWLHVRGLEIEREVKVYVSSSDVSETLVHSYELVGVRAGTLEHWLSRLHPGEAIDAYDDEGGLLPIARATLKDGAIAFDRALPLRVVHGSECLRLVRVRGVPSCALDEIDRVGKMTNEAIGDSIGRHRTLVAREVRAALRKAVAEGERRGIDGEDLVAALMGMGDAK